MKYLLDTHILIWHFEGSENLPGRIQEEILFNTDNRLYISIASLWEVAIKMSIGKYKFEGGFQTFYELVLRNEFSIMPIKTKHIEGLLNLPLIHRDPFDRLIISTSVFEKIPVVTADENIHEYNISWIW